MAELPGQLDIFSAIQAEVEGEPSAARALKVLTAAKENGWTENPYASLVLRLTRDDGLPFFCGWDLSFDPASGKRSWRFRGGRASNGQALNYQDVFTYLADPSVIHPEMPDEFCEAAQSEDLGQTEAGAMEALKPILPPEYGWGVLAR